MKKKISRKWLVGAVVIPLTTTIITIWASTSENTQTFGAQSPIVQDSQGTTINYQNTKNPIYLNNRGEELGNYTAKQIVERYFYYLNENIFREACALLPKVKCDVGDGEDIADFSREKMKYVNGYEDLEIWEPEIQNQHSNIICAKYSYILKSDANPQRVYEIFSFYIDKREDGEWEIVSRVCEKKFKDGIGARNCPISASIKFCI